MSTKKPCKNNPAYTFSGKESSPLGLGYTAESEQVGCTMEGRDKTMWMVGIKNGVKVWNRIPTYVVNGTATAEPVTPVKTEVKEEIVPAAPKKAPSRKATSKEIKDELKKDLIEEFTAVEEAPKKRAPAKKKADEAVVEKKPEDASTKKKEEVTEKKPEDAPVKKKVVKKKTVAADV